MKYQQYSLSGLWELGWRETGTGKPEDINALLASSNSAPCEVPGDIHIALTQAGVIRDPLVEENSKDCRWLEQQEFWYRKKFRIEEAFLQDRVELVLEGLDLTADIWLNGQHIGSHSNAFIEKIIGVTACLHPGENELVVRIDDGVHAVKNKPIDLMKPSWNNEQPYRAWMRKPQFVYGWDWTIWLPTCGIWKDVYLRSARRACVEDVYIATAFEGPAITQADRVELNIQTRLTCLVPGSYTLKCTVSPDLRYPQGETVHAQTIVTDSGEHALKLVLKEPQLWWPNGVGRPYLYSVTVSLEDEKGTLLHRKVLRHGLRTVSIREERLDERSTGFTFIINDTPIFAKGANHVPADCFPGRITAEKNRALLTMAADAHMNMIRVWGGGIYESDGFMDACDELGLMVWHDFMFACGYYPDHDPQFYEEIRRETTAAICRLRSHPSLVGWSGNNEIQEMYHAACSYGNHFPWYGGKLYEELLPAQVAALCPDRVYRQSSPFGGDEPASYDAGDQHTWHFTHRPGWEHYLDLWRFTDFDFKFLSEFGIIGAMNLESAKKCIHADALQPGSSQWRHHTNTSGDHGLVDVFVRKYFGYAPQDVQQYILHSQVLQAELMRHVYDELRSRKFRCSGILLWTLSDSYGIHNWSVIDYYLGKRPVYYYLKRSMAPVNVSFMGYEVQTFDGMAGYRSHFANTPEPVRILAANDTMDEMDVTLHYSVMTFDGKILAQENCQAVLGANQVQEIARADLSGLGSFVPEETILVAELRAGEALLSENRYFFAPYGKLALKKANVTCRCQRISETQTRLTLSADTFVWMLHLPDAEGVTFSDNDFDLLPGRPCTITLTGPNAASWNPNCRSLNPELCLKKEL